MEAASNTGRQLYGRIRDDLRRAIHAGRYSPESRLPSEAALMSEYRVSRITVRQALSDLEHEGLLFKVAGKGSFVSRPRPFQQLTQLQGLSEALGSQGRVRNRVLGLEIIPATDLVASRLALPAGIDVVCLQRLRLLDAQPLSLDISYLPARLLPVLQAADLRSRDVFDVLENDASLPLAHADLVLDAIAADGATASVLGVPVAAPLLRVERLSVARSGEPVDFEYLYCRTDQCQFRQRITR